MSAFGDCDPETVFELADGGLGPEQERKIRDHLAACPGCQDLYERELDLNACLSSLDLSHRRYLRSVSQGVVMALPTRPMGRRVLWGLLAGTLLIAALATLKINGTEPVLLAMGILSACWGFVASSADVTRVVLFAAGSTVLIVLVLGALADVVIALAVVSIRNRGRRTQEV